MASMSDEDRTSMREELLSFFDEYARELPWRENSDPYRVWVSEIMLQQTRVDTAIPYYRKWMERFPSVEALAEAPLDSVLEEWAGLGYYSRARNLHSAAAVVRERHGGIVPADLDGLRALPGVGDYTAGAVASIAFGIAAPAVDGNVRRVLSRIFDIEKPTAAILREHAAALVDPERPGDFNQSLMELGATVCTSRAPRCDDCPVRHRCKSFERGTVSLRPPTRRAKPAPSVDYAVAVLRFKHENEPWTILRRRPPSGLLGGMLEFPTKQMAAPVTAPPRGAHDQAETVARQLAKAVTTVSVLGARRIEPVPHRFSHLAATYRAFVFDLAHSPLVDADSQDELRLPWDALASAALSKAQRTIATAAERLEPSWRKP